VLGAAWVGWTIYESFVVGRAPGDTAYLQANTLFKDGAYERALEQYDTALTEAPDHLHALRGKARALMQLERYPEAERVYDEAIAREPEFAATYANRGILHDRTGRYEQAIADYEKALALDAELAEGPHWLTRFLRNQPEKPPGIADRAAYLRAELAKPEDQRVLSVPELDAEQRSYEQ
jgi:tetratricopeptide (TPR) repeat protein